MTIDIPGNDGGRSGDFQKDERLRAALLDAIFIVREELDKEKPQLNIAIEKIYGLLEVVCFPQRAHFMADGKLIEEYVWEQYADKIEDDSQAKAFYWGELVALGLIGRTTVNISTQDIQDIIEQCIPPGVRQQYGLTNGGENDKAQKAKAILGMAHRGYQSVPEECYGLIDMIEAQISDDHVISSLFGSGFGYVWGAAERANMEGTVDTVNWDDFFDNGED